MNKSRLLSIGKSILHSLLLIALTVVIFSVSNFLFQYNLFGEQYFLPSIAFIWQPIFLLLIFNSLVLAIHSYDKASKEKYLAAAEDGGFASAAKFILKSPEFYIEIALIVFLPIFNVLLLPLMIALNFGARVIILKNWYGERKKPEDTEKKKISPVAKRIAFIALVYCGVSMVAAWFMPLFATLLNVAGGTGILKIFLYVAVAILLVFAFVYIRAYSKRRSFITKLQKYCKTNQVNISEIKKPFLSVFFWHSGSDFTVEKDGKKFECKLIAGVFQGSPTVFSDKGKGYHRRIMRLFRITLFEFRTDFDFSFESDAKKILILSPTPKKIYVKIQGSSTRPADTGEKVGEYTIYNATGFLGALDRNCL